MSSTRSNKFLSTRYLEYRLEDGPNDNGDTLDYFQNPFQFSFLVLPNQNPTSLPSTSDLNVLTLPLSNYNTCIWRLAVYNPSIYDISGIEDVAYEIHARSGTIHFDGQNSASSTSALLNCHSDIFHSNVVCSPPPIGTEYPSNSYDIIETDGNNTQLVAIYNGGNINIQLNGWVNVGRVKGHLTIF